MASRAYEVVRPPPIRTSGYRAFPRTITNLSLNKLKSAPVRRETYVGPWLPEHLVTAEDDAGHEVERTEAW